MKRLFGIVSGLVLLGLSAFAAPHFVSGVYEKGDNITTPRPKDSKYFKTAVGGFYAFKNAAIYKLFIDVTQKRDKSMYLRVEFENPMDKHAPLTEEAPLETNSKSITLTSKPVKGLKIYSDYKVKVMLFESKEATKKPIDVLEQKVRSYVDTRGEEVKLYRGLREKK